MRLKRIRLIDMSREETLIKIREAKGILSGLNKRMLTRTEDIDIDLALDALEDFEEK